MSEPVKRRQVVKPPDEVSILNLLYKEKTYEDAEEELIKFVNEQISAMNNNLLFKNMVEPTFYALNQSLMNYESIAIGLTSLYVTAKFNSKIAEEKYEDLYAEKYAEEKMKQVSLGKLAQFTSAKEIEMAVRKNYLTELSQLKAEWIKAESKRSLIERLSKNWESYLWVLNSLSKNAQAEANASGIGSKNQKEFGDEGLE